MGQPTFNPAGTRLTHGLSEPGWVQPTFEKVEFFSTQPGSNPWWAGLAHGLKPILTSLSVCLQILKTLKTLDGMQLREDVTDSFIMQLIQCNGKILIRNLNFGCVIKYSVLVCVGCWTKFAGLNVGITSKLKLY